MKDLDVGHVIASKYVLVRLLGAGAMGQVWVARHIGLQQTFAIKLMVPDPEEGLATSLKRFENEAQIAAALSRKSRHIVRVSDYGADDGSAYLVMELLEGVGLEKRIGHGRKLHPAEVSLVITQLAKGLAIAHAEGVTHRDLKPANVFLTESEEGDLLVKVLDFGIARMAHHIVKKDISRAPTRLTVKGLVLGTPAYMSPEQAMAEPLDVRTDVWALAVLAFEALAGVDPFSAATPDDTILRICNFRPTPLGAVSGTAAPELEAVFARAFDASIAKRFQTATDFAETLAAALPPPARRLLPYRPAPHAQAPSDLEGGVSLKVPLHPRTVLSAIAVGVGALLTVAAALLGSRVLSSRSAPVSSHPQELHRDFIQPSATVAVPAPPMSVVTPPASTTLPPHVEPVRVGSPPPRVSVGAQTTTPTPTPSKSVDRSAIF